MKVVVNKGEADIGKILAKAAARILKENYQRKLEAEKTKAKEAKNKELEG